MEATTREVAACLASGVLELILLPTEACNFRCTYCYEDFRHGRMRPEVVRGVKRLLSRRAPELAALNLSWFGGEPLLARDIMQDVLRHARSLAREHPRLRLSSDITTNAYLLSRPVFERLLDLGVTDYQIAFDGPRSWHDRKRVLAGGGGTFDRVWGNLVAMRDAPGEFRVVVRLHVDSENCAALPDFIEAYQRTFGPDTRFTLFLRPLARLGGPNDDCLPVLDEEEGRKAVSALSQCARERQVEHFTMEEAPAGPGGASAICYAARANSFVVRADGRINKCTVALEHPMNQVGRIREDGRLELEASRMRGWMRGLWSGDPGELECPMKGYADPLPREALAPLLQVQPLALVGGAG